MNWRNAAVLAEAGRVTEPTFPADSPPTPVQRLAAIRIIVGRIGLLQSILTSLIGDLDAIEMQHVLNRIKEELRELLYGSEWSVQRILDVELEQWGQQVAGALALPDRRDRAIRAATRYAEHFEAARLEFSSKGSAAPLSGRPAPAAAVDAAPE